MIKVFTVRLKSAKMAANKIISGQLSAVRKNTELSNPNNRWSFFPPPLFYFVPKADG
jgi:hypothetical protein